MSSDPLSRAAHWHWHYTQEMEIVKASANRLDLNPFSESIFASPSKGRRNLIEQSGIASLHSQWHLLNWDLGSTFILDRKLLFLYVHPTGRLIANGVLNRLVPAKTHVDLQGSNKCTRRLGRGTEKALQRTLSKVNSGGSPHLFDCISLQNKTSHNSASQTSLTTFTYWIREGLAWLTKHLRGLAEKMKCIIKTWEGGRAEDFYAN